MDAKPKFNVIYSEEVIDFLNSLPAKTKAKIMFNVGKARYNLDPKLFKKLVGTDIWEFRTLYNGLQYRLLAFRELAANYREFFFIQYICLEIYEKFTVNSRKFV